MSFEPLNLKQKLELTGNKVRLRRNSAAYLEQYTESMMNSSLETIVLTSTAQVFTKEGIENYVRQIVTDPTRVDFLIFDRDRDELLGEVVIQNMDFQSGSASIRIAIDDKMNFNKGYGTEAMILSLNYGFAMKRLHRIELEVLEFNKRAVAAYERVGFKKEGIRREACYFNHKYHNLVTMSILSHEFNNLHTNESEELPL